MRDPKQLVAFVADANSPAPPPGVGRRVVVAVISALVVSAGSAAVMLTLIGQPEWWRGLIAATVVSALAAALSLAPLLWGLKKSLNATVATYFVAMGIRGAVSLGGCLLAIYAGGYPSTPTLVLMAVEYAAILAAEAIVVAAAVWSMGNRPGVDKTPADVAAGR